MRNRSIKLLSFVLLLTVFMTLCLTSCGIFGGIYAISDIFSSSQNESTEGETGGSLEELPGVTFPDGTVDKSGDKGDITQNTVIIEGSTNSIAYAASAGVRSIVSIYAKFSTGTSAGSGIIYKLDEQSGSAFIVTNYHVVYYGNSYTASISNDIEVYLYGMESATYAVPATFVGGSPNYDIAILRIENSEILKAAAQRGSVAQSLVADSDKISVGQSAIAIGNPESSGISVTSGIVSVDSEYITMTSVNGAGQVDFRVIRIDTAINSGNSGGGLFNDKGELIGVVNAKISKSDVENIGYAIPSNLACAVADNIIDNCYGNTCKTSMRAMLGVEIGVTELSAQYDTENGFIEKLETVAVKSVDMSGIAYGKLEVNDIIKKVTINGNTVEVSRRHHIIDMMLTARLGDTVEFTVIRSGAEKTVTVKITEDSLTAY